MAERSEIRAEESKTEPKEEKIGKNAERKSDQGLQWVVLTGNQTLVKVALNRGGDVNAKDDSGTPLLTLATLANNGEMIELLLERGAEIEGRGDEGGTALMSASFFGREEAALALLRAGADVNAENKKGETAIYLANLDFEWVEYFGKIFDIEVTEKNRAARERIVKALKDGGAKGDPWGWYELLAFVTNSSPPVVPPLPSLVTRDFFASRATREELQGASARLLDWSARMFGMVDPADMVVSNPHAGRVWADYSGWVCSMASVIGLLCDLLLFWSDVLWQRNLGGKGRSLLAIMVFVFLSPWVVWHESC